MCRIDYARLSEYFLDMAVVPAPLLRNRQGGIGYRVAPIAQLNREHAKPWGLFRVR